MFYIISSRIPLISSDFTKRKYFKVFIFGSVFYVLLHYYLNKQIRVGIPEKMRKFLFYIMGVDFSIACILLKYMKTAVPEEDTDDSDDDHSSQKQLDQPHLTKELEEQRRLFLEEHQRRLLHEKMIEQKAAEHRVAEQRAAEQRAAEQRAVEQRAAEQKKKSNDTEKSETEDEPTPKPTPKSKTSVKKEPVSEKKEVTRDVVAEKNNIKTENESELNTESELPIYDK
jgi:hypothetical protein